MVHIYSCSEEFYNENKGQKTLPLSSMIVFRLDDKISNPEAEAKEGKTRFLSYKSDFMESREKYLDHLGNFQVYEKCMKVLKQALTENRDIVVISPEPFIAEPSLTNFRRYVFCEKMRNYGGMQYSFQGEISFEKGNLISTLYVLSPQEIKPYQIFQVK